MVLFLSKALASKKRRLISLNISILLALILGRGFPLTIKDITTEALSSETQKRREGDSETSLKISGITMCLAARM